jgi:hypothetical protein
MAIALTFNLDKRKKIIDQYDFLIAKYNWDFCGHFNLISCWVTDIWSNGAFGASSTLT